MAAAKHCSPMSVGPTPKRRISGPASTVPAMAPTPPARSAAHDDWRQPQLADHIERIERADEVAREASTLPVLAARARRHRVAERPRAARRGSHGTTRRGSAAGAGRAPARAMRPTLAAETRNDSASTATAKRLRPASGPGAAQPRRGDLGHSWRRPAAVALDSRARAHQRRQVGRIGHVKEHVSGPARGHQVQLLHSASRRAPRPRHRGQQPRAPQVGGDQQRAARQAIDPHPGEQADQQHGRRRPRPAAPFARARPPAPAAPSAPARPAASRNPTHFGRPQLQQSPGCTRGSCWQSTPARQHPAHPVAPSRRSISQRGRRLPPSTMCW